LDLLDSFAVQRYIDAHKPDLIIHAAGFVGGILENARDHVSFMLRNLDLGRNVVVAAMRAGIPRLLNLGSSCMYPFDVENPLREEQILTGSLEPTNEGYAVAKIAILQLCRYINRECPGLAYKTLIPCNLYGCHDHFDTRGGHMLPMVIARLRLAKQNGAREVEIWGDGTARREYLYAGDLGDAIWAAVNDFDAVPAVMNVGSGVDESINAYYQAAAEIVGYSGRFVHDLTKPVGMQQKLLDVSRMKAWGFTPAHSLRAGLEVTYRYYLAMDP
jgi:GDP-L-fucose synthase